MKRLRPSRARLLIMMSMLATGLCGHVRADAPPSCYVESFRMSLADWNRVAPAIRDDHRTLYDKCRATAGQGKIERIERLGGSVAPGQKSSFEAADEITYASSFISNGRMLMPDRMVTRIAGSRMECEIETQSSQVRLVYGRTLPPLWQPMLADGIRDDVKRSEVPIFDTMRINGCGISAEGGGPRLIGAVPVPTAGGQPVQMALAFALATTPRPAPGPGRMQVLLEMLVLRGPTGATSGDPSNQIKSLLTRPGSIVTDIAVSSLTDQYAVAESITEWIHPHSARRHGDFLVPEQLSSLNQGTKLMLECGAANAGSYPVRLSLDHDLRKPLLPITDGHAPDLISPKKPVPYRITVNEKLTMTSGAWIAVKEVPLAPILGELDPTANKDSCYVFGRILNLGTSNHP